MFENIAEVTVDQIDARIADIVAEFNALGLTPESSDEDIAKGEALAAEVKSLREEVAKREQAAVERKERLSALSDTFAEDEQPAGAVEDGAAVQPEEPVVEAPEPVVEHVDEPMPVAASAEKHVSPAKRAAAHSQEVKMPKQVPAVVLTAAADVPGYPNGQELESLTAAGDALVSRMRGMPSHHIPDTRMRFGAAVIRRTFDPNLEQDSIDDYGLIHRAGSERRLSGGSLVAAGGWCAPSETMYDLCQYETVEGILSLPEVQVKRGGIRYTKGPDFSTIYTGCGSVQTEAQAIAGTAKKCCEVTCPAFTDVRLDAVQTCVKAPILTNAAYPELVRRYIEGAFVAHIHRVNTSVISKIETAAGTAVAVPTNDTLLFNLDHLEWQAVTLRYAYRLGLNASVEVVVPFWLKALIRAELGRRTGVQLHSVSDAQIDEWFSVRGLAPQYVVGWQDLTSKHALQAIPATAKVLMYPAGSWVKGMTDVINLDAVYDSTGLSTNVYTALFFEEGVLSIQRCLGTTLLSVPVKVTGKTAGAIIDEAMGTTAVPLEGEVMETTAGSPLEAVDAS